ncbi:MAG: hypothetical protein KIT22_06045 [Verrucomicrobiae bacterium]|nr:hypothetical protein [Verrucomicrobiae bacterium]
MARPRLIPDLSCPRQNRAGIPVLKRLCPAGRFAQVHCRRSGVWTPLEALKQEEWPPRRCRSQGPRPRPSASEPFLRNEPAEGAAGLLEGVLRLRDDSSVLVLRQLAFTLGETRVPR